MDLKNMTNDKKLELTEDPNTPSDVLRDLAKNEFWLKRPIALNNNTPEDVLLGFTQDQNWVVRRNVAMNPKSSITVIVMLFGREKNLKKPNIVVIRALYNNHKLPYVAKVILETLFGEWL